MAYRFKLDEPASKGFRRVAREQIARAGHELDTVEQYLETASVHESRKAIKRLRALLRLMRPVIGEKAFKTRNAGLRDIAAAMSGTRDHSILNETIAKLEARFGRDAMLALQPLHDKLNAAAARAPLDAATLNRIRDALAVERRGIDKLKLKGKGFELLAPGLEQSYGRGRLALVKAYKKPSDHSVHDLRKAVQWHWRQMAVISRAWPAYFDVRVAGAREVSQILGDDHDLAVLLHFVETDRAALASDSGQIETMIRMRQQELREEAHPRAARLFAEPPKAFVRRMACYWETAGQLTIRGETSSEDVQNREIPGALPTQPDVPRLTVMADNDDPSQRRA